MHGPSGLSRGRLGGLTSPQGIMFQVLGFGGGNGICLPASIMSSSRGSSITNRPGWRMRPAMRPASSPAPNRDRRARVQRSPIQYPARSSDGGTVNQALHSIGRSASMKNGVPYSCRLSTAMDRTRRQRHTLCAISSPSFDSPVMRKTHR